MTESSTSPMAGLWKPTHLTQLYYGSGSVEKHLLSCLPRQESRVFIITGSSLANKTDLVRRVETLLADRHAGTFSDIRQHAPVAQLDQAADRVLGDERIDCVVSIGGGSPIDSAKAISYRLSQKSGRFLHHVAIPTTLSAAECSPGAGYTDASGQKTGVAAPECAPAAILYDSSFALATPERLWMSTGLRALDHAVELMYHPTATEVPCRHLAITAAADLATYLPRYMADPKDEDVITRLQLAAYASLGFLGLNTKGGLGLSHALGYALGSPYGIPHGITSCLTLGRVVKIKAGDAKAAEQISRLCPSFGINRSGDDKQDAQAVGQAIIDLVRELGLSSSLTEYKVGKDQVPVVAKTATRTESGELYDAVTKLVQELY